MKKTNLYYFVWVVCSAAMTIAGIYAVYSLLIPPIFFYLTMICSLGSLAISCYEWERHIKSVFEIRAKQNKFNLKKSK